VKASMLGIVVIAIGIVGVVLISFFGKTTTTNDQNYYLLKEVTDASFIDALDLVAYRYGYTDDNGTYYEPGIIKIDEQKFVEIFVRRYAESADIARNYKISFYEILEIPPKVVIRVEYTEPFNLLETFVSNKEYEFTISEDIVGILEETVKGEE